MAGGFKDHFSGHAADYQRYRRQTGQDPLAPLRPALESAWGDPSATRQIVWPLAMLVARPRP